MWCDGLVGRRRSSPKQAQSEDVGSDSELTMARPPKRKQTEREDKVLEIMDNLKESHFLTLHVNAIWAEMIASGTHSSTEDPLNTTMF